MRIIKWVLIIAILAVCGYVGYKFAVPYYQYHRFKADSTYIIYENRAPENAISNLLEFADSLGIYIPEGNLKYEYTKDGFRLTASWTTTVDFFGKYQKTLEFSFHKEE